MAEAAQVVEQLGRHLAETLVTVELRAARVNDSGRGGAENRRAGRVAPAIPAFEYVGMRPGIVGVDAAGRIEVLGGEPQAVAPVRVPRLA